MNQSDVFYDKNKLRFFEIVNELSMIDNKRSVFFKMCCDKEVELIFNNEPPLVFYWCDYFKYEESGFDCVLELSKLLTSNYLSQKKQLPIEIIKYHINDIIISFKHTFEGLKKVILFGSVAKHTNTETSDIDLLLIFDINNPLSNRMSFILKEEFYKNTGRILDVSFVFKGQSNRFIEWILSYGIEVYSDEK